MVVLPWASHKKFRATREKYLRDPPPQFDGFGTESYMRSTFDGRPGLSVKLCSEEKPCPALVTLYARFGLHRYNLLNRTNFDFIRVFRYNYLVPRASSTYFITFSATEDPNSPPLTFQTKVDEHGRAKLARTCYIARLLQDDQTKTNPNHRTSGGHSVLELPEWPPQNPFHTFYLLEESELSSHDWIRLYLELCVAIPRGLSDQLSDLKILKVVIDTKEDGEGLFYAKEATVYIHFKDPCEARVEKDVDRLAIVRRNYDDQTGCFSFAALNQSSAGIDIAMPELKAKNQSSAGFPIPKRKGKNGGGKFIRLLGVRKRWRLSSPKRHKAYKSRNRGLH